MSAPSCSNAPTAATHGNAGPAWPPIAGRSSGLTRVMTHDHQGRNRLSPARPDRSAYASGRSGQAILAAAQTDHPWSEYMDYRRYQHERTATDHPNSRRPGSAGTAARDAKEITVTTTPALHTEIYPYCRISYWSGNVAATSDEEWTHCRVELFGMSPCGHEFNNKRDRDHFLRFMDQVYERGRNAAKQELRDWLGVKS